MDKCIAWLTTVVLVFTFAIGCAKAEETTFPTDEVVRSEMKAIRDLTLNVHTLVTHRRMPPAEARTFHERITAAVERLEDGTTLTDASRDEIAALAHDISEGAAAVAGLDETMSPIDGIVAIDEALSLYAKRFEHPGWQPLR